MVNVSDSKFQKIRKFCIDKVVMGFVKIMSRKKVNCLLFFVRRFIEENLASKSSNMSFMIVRYIMSQVSITFD